MIDQEKYDAAKVFPNYNRVPLFQIAKNNSLPDGLVLEFGVWSGESIVQIQNIFGSDVYGFDSWYGLPETDKYFIKGEFNRNGKKPEINNSKIHLIDGWFSQTIEPWSKQHPGHIRFVNVDSDVYSSANEIFTTLQDRFVKGTTIYFDEYKHWNGWEEREYKAFLEFIDRTGFDYKYLARSEDEQHAVVQLI